MTVRNQVNFAQVPEWVLYADISAQAVRLYAILNRHANKYRRANPSRRLLARLLGVKSTDTVDRCLRELVALGAVSIEPQNTPGREERTTNDYLVRFIPPGSRTDAATSDDEQASDLGVSGDGDEGSRTDAATSDGSAPEVAAGIEVAAPIGPRGRMDAAQNDSELEREDLADANASARSPGKVTEEQGYVVGRIWHHGGETWERSLTYGGVTRLNQEFGAQTVTDLLRRVKVDLVEGRLGDVRRPFAYIRGALAEPQLEPVL